MDPVAPALQYVLSQVGIAETVTVAPYNQIFQELLSPGSTLRQPDNRAVVMVVRPSDFNRDRPVDGAPEAIATALASEFVAALKQFNAASSTSVVLQLLLDGSAYDGAFRRCVQEQTTALTGLNLVVCGPEEGAWNPALDLDAQSDALAHIPYTDSGFRKMAHVIARAIHAVRAAPHKVLVLDCDNTIWRGVVGEDGVTGIGLSQPFLAVQAFARRAKATGVLICLASKNTESDVLEVFAQRPDMVLSLDDIVTHRINWLPKSQNIADMARELNLGLDSFVFLDDNPVECGQMREALPEVVTLQLPGEDGIEKFLANLWVFDKAVVTEEDARRTEMYLQNRERDLSEQTAGDIGAFIASLNMQVDIAVPADEEWARVSQLTYRTNQFNFTTQRIAEPELRARVSRGGLLVSRVSVSDRFGEYGIVGVLMLEVLDDVVAVDTFLLSCRVLGRGVEHAMLRFAGEEARRLGCARVVLRYRKTSKNEPARAFADSVVRAYAHAVGDDPAATDYAIPVDACVAVTHRPGEDPDAVVAARKGDAAKPPKPADASRVGRSERYALMAAGLEAPALWSGLQAERTQGRALAEPPVPAATDVERGLAQIWMTELCMPEIGVEDDFFALGGTSLAAARVFAAIERAFGQRLRMTAIMEAPTIRRLAALLEHGLSPSSNIVELRRGSGERTLWLLHDGDGETLLYKSLAERLPADVSVYGIEPLAQVGVPMAAFSVEHAAQSYVGLLRARQPHGPYALGGLCAGGLLAHEVGRQLEAAGEHVDLVVMMDSAAPNAQERRGRIAGARLARVGALLAGSDAAASSPLTRLSRTASGLGRKVINALRWEIGSRWRAWSVQARFAYLAHVLKSGRGWPSWLTPLTVREIYDACEARYHLASRKSAARVVLLRASAGEGDDVPFREVYEEPDLGWQRHISGIQVVDVPGGHASMLQVPHVDHMAELLTPLLTEPHENRAHHA